MSETAQILTVEGHRAPPSAFVRRLEAFDPNLRVVWGLGQAVPFPGWVIERRIPDAMKAKVYGGKIRPANQQRYADQIITDTMGGVMGGRRYDMMPDWHPVYQVRDKHGPILELGDFVIDFLRRTYERTLLGHPELALKHLAADRAEKEARELAKHEASMDKAARTVMDHKNEIFPDVFAHSGQSALVMEGTELYGSISEKRNDPGGDQGSSLADTESQATH